MDGEVKKKGKESENLSQIIEMLNKKIRKVWNFMWKMRKRKGEECGWRSRPPQPR